MGHRERPRGHGRQFAATVPAPSGPMALSHLHAELPFADHGSDPDELEALRSYMAGLCRHILKRHSYEDFLLVRTLNDYHQHVAMSAKLGDLARATQDLAALRSLRPRDPELASACKVSSEPVEALIAWKQGDDERAIRHMHVALSAAAHLADTYEHDYLTARRIYLATNVARVLLGSGRRSDAHRLCQDLAAVVEGDAARWPYESSETLRVPFDDRGGAWVAASLTSLLRATTREEQQ